MKVKCIHCDEKYFLGELNPKCPACGQSGGFNQEIATRSYQGLHLHLEEILIHTESLNQYQIKEFQEKGIVVKIIGVNIIEANGKPAYISNNNISEYTRKEK